ncbi:MAG: YlxR family protein [Chloroflexi bacterium]|nr:YlxR family protein [Chloroflexota bacterium]
MTVKSIPQRTCLGCRQTKDKKELVRLVKTPSGEVMVDPTGKREGRGAYLCPTYSCWAKGLSKNHIGYALRTIVSPSRRDELLQYIKGLPGAGDRVEGELRAKSVS